MESKNENFGLLKEIQNKKLLLLVTKAPYSSQEPYNAYKFANFLVKQGINPIIFHFMDGIYNLSNLPIHAQNFIDLKDEITNLIDNGVRIIACSRCLLARGFWDKEKSSIKEKLIIPKNILDKVEIFGIQKLLDFIKNGYKVIKY